ncbi:E3 ubiquitin-protein ligase TRIM7-like isoform X2 [Paroedura picta]|uniref:E3 ubiquitin-protein ligase TRIM7-like isoform X2 n=1 Tax=Paroedura picta TaxID=143630 RepID=UPI004057A609
MLGKGKAGPTPLSLLPLPEAAMASGGPVEELCEAASCSVCLEYFQDPVMIPECRHNFCRACLDRTWGDLGKEASCPLCRGRAQPRNLLPNQQLANMVETIQKLRPLEAKGAEGRGRVCQEHREPLKLFCRDDKALVCVACDKSKEHRGHQTLLLGEASQEYKGLFCYHLVVLKKEKKKIVAYKGEFEKESREVLSQTTGAKQETAAKFRQLHRFLEAQEKLLAAQMEELEKEIAAKRDQHLAELSEALSALESLIREVEEKCQQSPSELLQDVRNTLQRYEGYETFAKPETSPLALKWRIWDFCDINHLLEGALKQLKETLDSGLPLQKANVTLDPDTVQRYPVVSEDQKSVGAGIKTHSLPDNPGQLDHYAVVLGREGFTAGRHFWEVLVGSEEDWMVGVARKSVTIKGCFPLSPEEGVWSVGKWKGSHRAYEDYTYLSLNLSGELKRIRVCLNYDGGRVAFFDADRGDLLYEYSGASFSGETLLPFFWVNVNGHLTVSS